ncbi:MAG: hypothetical protein HY763_13490 [Planctomycetes bacterium]|nr:hypothetical protein [Planctomycetota bacterium]
MILLERLHSLRRIVRRRLIAYGALAVLAGGVAAFLTVVILDWLLWLPAVLRLAVSVLFFTGFLLAARHWIIAPFRAGPRLEQVAARMERHFTGLGDRLSSVLSFLGGAAGASPAMVRRFLGETEDVVAQTPLESVLTLRPLALAGAVLAFAVAALATLATAAPDWTRTGLYRYLHPFGAIEWPRTVSLRPLTGGLSVALGESVTVRMSVERGWYPTLRGMLHLRESDGDTVTLAMQHDGEGTYSTTVDAVTEDLTYWFEADDDSTRLTPFTIHVVRRPEVLEAVATVEPPAYVRERTLRKHDLREGPIRAPVGGTVCLALRTSKPVLEAGTDEPRVGLRCADGTLIPLVTDAADPTRLSARLGVVENLSFRVELVDREGFENRGAAEHSIVAVPDHPPVVTMLEPQAAVELTPRASLRLVARVEDDFGITGLELAAERASSGESRSLPLTDQLAVTPREEGVEALAEYLWSLESWGLKPGDVLSYALAATDNRETGDAPPQTGRSTTMRIRIISDTEFDVRLRDELALLEGRVRQVALQERRLMDETGRLLRTEPNAAPLSDDEREQASSQAAQQFRLARVLRELAVHFSELHRRAEQNLGGDADARQRIASAGLTLQQIATGPMNAAGSALSGAAEQASAPPQQEALRQASQEETAAAEALQTLLRAMTQWGDFQGLLAKTRDLADRQDELRRQTVALGKTMLGKSLEALTDAEEAALRRTQQQQEQLAGDVELLLGHMEQLQHKLGEKDPAGAEALDAAIRAGRAQDVLKRLRDAAAAIAANRTAAATLDQQTAAETIRRMIAALRDRENRELAVLRKQVERAEDQVAELVEKQRALRRATDEAGQVGADAAAFATLEEDQRALRRNTRLLGDELEADERMDAAGRLVREASQPMTEAELKLGALDAPAAVPAQDEALALLAEALARLEALAEEMAEQAMRRSLAQIRDDLQAVQTAQQTVNAAVEALRRSVAERGGLSRAEYREATRIGREQADVRGLLDDVSPDLQKVPVFDWAVKRVGDWMDSCRDWLEKRKIDEELAATGERVVRELERLIQAVRETESLPLETEFAEAEGGGGGGGQSQSGRPVPTVAELLVLKAMQADIHRRTGDLARTLDINAATEVQLRELKTLGEDQAQVRKLTEMVTARAQHP